MPPKHFFILFLGASNKQILQHWVSGTLVMLAVFKWQCLWWSYRIRCGRQMWEARPTYSDNLEERATIEEQKAAIEKLHWNMICFLPESHRKYAYTSQEAWEMFFTPNSAFMEQIICGWKGVRFWKRQGWWKGWECCWIVICRPCLLCPRSMK